MKALHRKGGGGNEVGTRLPNMEGQWRRAERKPMEVLSPSIRNTGLSVSFHQLKPILTFDRSCPGGLVLLATETLTCRDGLKKARLQMMDDQKTVFRIW